jgi:hypothetical protein
VVDFAPASFTLFGGVGAGDGGLVTLGDTWTWDGSQWIQATIVSDASTGPTPRSGASVVTLGSSQYFYGGVAADGTYDFDFWQWDGVTWSQIFVPCPPKDSGLQCVPSARADAAVAALPGQPSADGGIVDELVLFGGRSPAGPIGTSPSQPSVFPQGDTWIYDQSTWTQVTPRTGSPPPRWGAAAFSLNGKVGIFGGTADGLTALADTWIWDGQAQTWTQVAVNAPAPSARGLASVASYGSATGPNVVLFGGTNGVTDLDDMWTWDGATWTQVTQAGPGPRSAAAMGTLGESLLLFGGLHAGVPLGDFWSWNGSTWQNLPRVSGNFPQARGGAGASGT